MEAASPIVPLEDLEPISLLAASRIAAIAFGPRGAKPNNVATVTAVNIAGANFLVTALHVVEDDAARRLPWWILQPQPSPGGQLPSRRAIPATFSSGPDQVLWTSPALDIAILRPPGGMVIETFPGDSGAIAARRVRERPHARESVLVTGFPLFTRDNAPDQPLALCGCSLPGFIVGGDRPSHRVEAPKIIVNVGCKELRPEFRGKPEGELFAQQLESQDREPLAGLSGAPVTWVTQEANYLVGILVQGTRRLEAAFVRPWDVISTAFSESLLIRPGEP